MMVCNSFLPLGIPIRPLDNRKLERHKQTKIKNYQGGNIVTIEMQITKHMFANIIEIKTYHDLYFSIS